MVKIINKSVCRGVAGRRAGNVKGVVIHNDAGSMTAEQYVNWLANKTVQGLEAGFAHYYIDRFTIARVEDTYNGAWHTANYDGNMNYIGYEVCQSMSASDADFLANEQMVFKQVAEDLKYYNLPVNRDTVRLHREFSSTSCPHRSWALHGQSVNAVKDYFISQILKYYNGTATNPTPTPTPTPSTGTKTVTIANHATHYSPSSKGAKIADWVKGGTFQVKEERAINYSNSNREYLITNKGVPLGWVLSQDIVGGYNKPTTPTPSNTGKWIAENGTFIPNITLPLTVDASGNGALIANIGAGNAIKYDAYMIDSNYVWIRQPRANGYGYMATGYAKNGKRVDYWGTFR